MTRRITVYACVFAALGLGLGGGGLYWANNTRAFIDRTEEAPGTVVAVQLSGDYYHPVVQFNTAAGQSRIFRSSVGSRPSTYDVGESVTVVYDPSRPTEARIRSFLSLWGGPAGLGGLGTVFFLVGGGILLGRRLSAARGERLQRYGTPVVTEYQGVERNTCLSINGQHPWRIVTQWQDPRTGTLHLFHSQNLWFDPTRHINKKQITVYVDRKAPKHHHMDVSFLPKLAE